MIAKVLKRRLRVGLLLVIALFAFYFWQKSNQPLLVEVVSPETKAFNISISTPGELKAEKTVDLKPVGTGKLASLNVAEGDKVAAGQVLGAINTVEAQSSLDNAVIARDKAIAAADEIRETYGEDITWGIGYYRLKQAEKAIKQAETQITYYSQQLSNQVVTAPFAGMILNTSKQPGELASSLDASPLLKLADLNSLYFSIQIDEEDIGKAKVGQEVKVELDGLPNVIFSGQIKSLKNYTSTDSTGAKVIEAKVALSEKQDLPKVIGLSGDAEIVMEKIDKTSTLPLDAIRYDNNTPYLFLVQNGVVVRKEVEIGKENDNLAQIVTPLEGETQVILDSNKEIKAGRRVKSRE